MDGNTDLTPVAEANGNPLAGSFEARMQERRKERESRTTEVFDPPGFEDLFRVEMQTIGYNRLAIISKPHERQRDEAMKALYTNADLILNATVKFYQVKDEGTVAQDLAHPDYPELELIEDGSWVSMARIMYPELDPVQTRPRVALIRLLEGVGVGRLANEWMEWNTRGNAQVDRELRQDFSLTG